MGRAIPSAFGGDGGGLDPLVFLAGVPLTADGDETAYAFSAGASVTDGDDGTLSYVWTLEGKPSRSAKTSANIANATTLAGATFDAFDEAGVFVFGLTVTRASDGAVLTVSVPVTVGRDGWRVAKRIDYTAQPNLALAPDGVYAIGGINHETVGTVNANVSCAVVNGSGVYIEKTNAVGNPVDLLIPFSQVFPVVDRTRDYAVIYRVAFSQALTLASQYVVGSLWQNSSRNLGLVAGRLTGGVGCNHYGNGALTGSTFGAQALADGVDYGLAVESHRLTGYAGHISAWLATGSPFDYTGAPLGYEEGRGEQVPSNYLTASVQWGLRLFVSTAAAWGYYLKEAIFLVR